MKRRFNIAGFCCPSNHSMLSWLLASAAFTAFLLVFFFPVVFQGKIVAPLDILDHLMRPWSDGTGGFGVHNAMVYDAISQYLPYDWTVCQSLQKDGYIGWNPYVYAGYPLLENTMLCPGDWHHLLYRFLDFWTAWDLGIVLQFALAGFGMLVMLRGEGRSAVAALLGAICFTFYSQHTVWIYHRWVLGASCWFPWMVWAIRRARRRERWADPWAIVFTGLAFRGGSLQTCLFVVLLVACLFAADVWECRGDIRCRRHWGRFIAFYASLAILSSLLAIDVLLDTVAPCLSGMRDIGGRTFLQCIKTVPHWATLLLPSSFGSPQTMDVGKAFGADMFETKFAGTTVFILAYLALLRRQAPLAAKLCLSISLLATATPLVNWFYARSTVVLAIGCAWLAAWTLDHADEAIPARAWRWIARCGVAVLALWTAAGVAMTLLTPRLVPAMHRFVEASLRAGRESRHDWMLARADAFVAEFPPWTTHKAVPVLLAAAGLFAVWRLVRTSTHETHKRAWSGGIWAVVTVLCAFGELFVWSRTWVTFSERPDTGKTGTLYPVPSWAANLRREMVDGGLLWIHDRASDFDYLQINSQAGLGVACFQGYETICPRTLDNPERMVEYDPGDFAARGISHVLVKPGVTPPSGLARWTEVLNDEALHLYRNPAFDSRWHAVLADGSRIPVRDESDSPNVHRFRLPVGTVGMSLAEPFHRGWCTMMDGAPLPGEATAQRQDGGTFLAWTRPLPSEAVLERQFKRIRRSRPTTLSPKEL